jgi:hypothetical protein
MPPIVRTILLATCAAIVGVVIYHQFFRADADAAWEALGVASASQSVQALEAARDQISGGSAKAWADYQLAIRLYDQGGSENFERARQVAQSALAANSDHATAPWLQRLVAAIGTYDRAATAQ